MAHGLRKEVLNAFKSLHRARKRVFEGDKVALEAGRIKINEEFRKNKHVSDETAIAELVRLSKEVEKELLQNVIQAKEDKPGVFTIKLRPETTLLDNVPYKENAT